MRFTFCEPHGLLAYDEMYLRDLLLSVFSMIIGALRLRADVGVDLESFIFTTYHLRWLHFDEVPNLLLQFTKNPAKRAERKVLF